MSRLLFLLNEAQPGAPVVMVSVAPGPLHATVVELGALTADLSAVGELTATVTGGEAP